MTIRSQLLRLSENGIRIKVFIPLLKALGAFATEDFQGPFEKGKDIYFAYKNLFSEYKHCCFFIKVGNIKKSGKNDVRKMKQAIEEAVVREFTSPLDNKTPIHIEEFYFVCSGKINQDARDYISELLIKRQMPNFRIYDVDRFIDLIEELLLKYNSLLNKNYQFATSNFKDYCEKVCEHLEKSKVNSQLPMLSNLKKGREGEVFSL
jgi:hypothetical protein